MTKTEWQKFVNKITSASIETTELNKVNVHQNKKRKTNIGDFYLENIKTGPFLPLQQ